MAHHAPSIHASDQTWSSGFVGPQVSWQVFRIGEAALPRPGRRAVYRHFNDSGSQSVAGSTVSAVKAGGCVRDGRDGQNRSLSSNSAQLKPPSPVPCEICRATWGHRRDRLSFAGACNHLGGQFGAGWYSAVAIVSKIFSYPPKVPKPVSTDPAETDLGELRSRRLFNSWTSCR